MKETRVFIPSDGIQLEGLLSIQEAPSLKGGVICCHPHPQYGGNMDHPVLIASLEAAVQEGFSTLRFNLRGVGESGGSYDEGVGEKRDVGAVADYFYSRLRGNHLPLILVGYSFGAWTGFPVAVEDERFIGMVGIAPPLEIYDFGFLKGCKKRKLLIAGDRDAYCPTPLLEKWYDQLDEPKSLSILPGADHFLFSHTRFLIEPIREFLRAL